jgi:3-hydroxyacyl-[acyl-carrier-protein] dehydratase
MSRKVTEEGLPSVSFPRNHPAFAGHFPANPIVPGVLILEAVQAVIVRQYPASPDYRLVTIPRVKFVKVLRPEQEMHIESIKEDGVVRFRCSCGTATIATGEMRLGIGD